MARRPASNAFSLRLDDLNVLQREWVRRYGDGSDRPWLEWLRSLEPAVCNECGLVVLHPRRDEDILCGLCAKAVSRKKQSVEGGRAPFLLNN
jgi:hypothetical protein